MAISEPQLQVWTHSPGTTRPQFTHDQIRKALLQSFVKQVRESEVYLQGSYSNSTNVKTDSDVDVVVQLNSVFSPDLDNLNDFDKSIFNLAYDDATYHWTEFRLDVIKALESYFGADYVTAGNKRVKLAGNDQQLDADVVPCFQYRKYNSFSLDNRRDFIEGMKFWTARENQKIINYPKHHKENGENKNCEKRTNQIFKDVVRIMKNIKRCLVEDHGFDPAISPSYFIECAIYNVPDNYFQSSYRSSIENVLEFMLRQCDPANLITASRQHLLFGNESWQWNLSDFYNFFQTVEEFYKNG